MNFSKEAKKGEAWVKIQGQLTINDVSELKKNVLEWFETNKSLTLDLEGVSLCDTSVIQILFCMKKTAAHLNKTFSIVSAADCIISVCNQIGLDFEQIKS